MNNEQKSLKNKKEFEGKEFSTKYGTVRIEEYKSAKCVSVVFTETGYRKIVKLCHVLSGKIKDKLIPTVVGVGIIGDERVSESGKLTHKYSIWKSMLVRCYDKKYAEKYTTYEDCSVSESFKYLSKFSLWCNRTEGFLKTDDRGNNFVLDKDILVKGNKVYSEDTCCFVPEEINVIFTKSDKTRGKYPIGVSLNKQGTGYVARTGIGGGKHLRLGTYNSANEAFEAYKQAKEKYIKKMAEKWKGQIDPKVYNALMKYRVEITD